MAFEASFVSGDTVKAKYTPVGAIAAGEVVVIGGRVAIPPLPIAAGALGSVAVSGGVWRGVKTAGSSTAVAGLTKLYWDNSGNVPTVTASSNKPLGYTVPDGAADDDTTIDFVLDPSF